MRTEELVTLLASDAGAVPRHVAARRYALALAVGLAGAAVLMATLLGMRADLATATQRVAEELNSQYVLGYNAPRGADGQYHSIRVRVSQPGYRVRSRRGYIAEPLPQKHQ